MLRQELKIYLDIQRTLEDGVQERSYNLVGWRQLTLLEGRWFVGGKKKSIYKITDMSSSLEEFKKL